MSGNIVFGSGGSRIVIEQVENDDGFILGNGSSQGGGTALSSYDRSGASVSEAEFYNSQKEWAETPNLLNIYEVAKL